MKANAKRAGKYEGIRKLVRGLRAVASGEVLDEVLAKSTKYLQGRVKGELARHKKGTGLALSSSKIELDSKAIDITLQRYRRYIKWSFAKGIPVSALNRIAKIANEALAKVSEGGAK